MTCLRIPTSLEAADALIVACSGHADWRPLFVLGVQSLAVIVVAIVVTLLVLRRLTR